jgi:PPM family protein phosphatase
MGELVMMELIFNPNIVLSFLFALTSFLGISNLSARRAEAKFRNNIPDVRIGNGQILGDREKQEDSFATEVLEYGVFAIVADGIGSYVNGRVASKLAVATFLREFRKMDISDNIPYFFNRTALNVNSDIKALYGDIPVGTTIAAAIIRYNRLYYGWAGDSTIAIYRAGSLINLNEKDNVGSRLEELYHSGRITREDVLKTPYQERLVNYVGHDEFQGLSLAERVITLKKGDLVLLYSDGLETLRKIEIEGILSNLKTPELMVDQFMTAIRYKKVNNKDNATVIILKINQEYRK